MHEGDAATTPAVRACPFCGEPVGSFWARRGTDGSHWCESCLVSFRVLLAADDDRGDDEGDQPPASSHGGTTPPPA